MELKKCRKNYWSRMVVLIIIITGGVFLNFGIKYCHSEEKVINSNVSITTAPRMISTNIKWQNSICKVVLDEIELLSVLDKESYKTKLSHEGFIELTDKDTLIVDSLSYIRLKEYVVSPEYHIDSICESEGIEGLLSTYFDDIWFIPCSDKDRILSLSEQRYLIYLLLQNGYSAKIDCESGYLYIIKNASFKE